MADKQISDLAAATSVQTADLFVLEQSGTAKKLTGQIWMNWLINQVGGMGTIRSIAKTGTRGTDPVIDTYTITFAKTEFVEGDDPADWQESEVTYSFDVVNGLKGDQGDTWYFYLRYASDLPTSDADMSTTPDNYIGVYYGTATTAPTHYTDYIWYQWKGDKGDTGEPARIASQSVTYLSSTSGTVVPEGSWTTTIPSVPSGYYLWCRTRIVYADETNTTITSYSVSRNGIDGMGAVSSVNNLSPDPNGNIALTASDIPTGDSTSVQEHITQIESDITDLATYEVRHISGTLTSLPAEFSYGFITADHRVINCVFGTPSALTSDVTWTTSAGSVVFSGTLANLATTSIDFDIVKVAT